MTERDERAESVDLDDPVNAKLLGEWTEWRAKEHEAGTVIQKIRQELEEAEEVWRGHRKNLTRISNTLSSYHDWSGNTDHIIDEAAKRIKGKR